MPKIPKFEPIAKPIEEPNIVLEVEGKQLNAIVEVEIKDIEKASEKENIETPTLVNESIVEVSTETLVLDNELIVEEDTETPILDNESLDEENAETPVLDNVLIVEEDTKAPILDNESLDEENTETPILDNGLIVEEDSETPSLDNESLDEENTETHVLDNGSIDEEDTEIPALDNVSIKDAISEFAESLPISIRSLFKILPINTHDGQILIKANKQQFPQINDTKQKLQFFLRDYFKMETLQLIIEETNDILLTDTKYTATEQFDDLIEIDNKFKYLVQKLRLKVKSI